MVCRPSHRAWCGAWTASRCCWAPSPICKADSAPVAAVMALMVIGTTAGAVARPCGTGEGGAKEEREVGAQDEGEAMDVDEIDNEDTGAGAEDEQMASQEEQRNAHANARPVPPIVARLVRGADIPPQAAQRPERRHMRAVRVRVRACAPYQVPCR